MGKIIVDGVEFETVGKPKVVPYNSVTKDLLDAYSKGMKEQWLIKEMEICRSYCSVILSTRQKSGFNSVKYPLFSVKINRYFLPSFREIIANECNLIGYMDIPPVELFDVSENIIPYEDNKEIVIKLDTQKGHPTQEEIFKSRNEKREGAIKRKLKIYE